MTLYIIIQDLKNNFIMEKIVNRLINDAVVGVDKYTNNGSTWLIFTETKQWVIELTKEGTLWYNYNYFIQYCVL